MEPLTHSFVLTHLEKGYVGLHDEYSTWAYVYNRLGEQIERMTTEIYYESNAPYQQNWTVADYIAQGYTPLHSILTTITDNEVF